MRRTGLGTRDSGLGIRGSGFATTIVILTLFSACNSKSVSKAREPLPLSGEVAGWEKSGETRVFPAANLWEYIDGDAEKYLQAGVERTLTADYRYQNKIEAVADIYVMKTPEGARKIFESESGAGSQRIQLGDDARLFPATLSFRKGPYFVRLTAYQEAPEIGAALRELGRAMERKLGAGS
jgi:hypothetical protein